MICLMSALWLSPMTSPGLHRTPTFNDILLPTLAWLSPEWRLFVTSVDGVAVVVDGSRLSITGQLTQDTTVIWQSLQDCIQLAACKEGQKLPLHPELPADLFTSCLTTPIHMSIQWSVVVDKWLKNTCMTGKSLGTCFLYVPILTTKFQFPDLCFIDLWSVLYSPTVQCEPGIATGNK